MAKPVKAESPILSFDSEAAFDAWLRTKATPGEGIWLRFLKKSATTKGLTHAGALDVALCHGWIDGQLKTLDEQSYLQKFTPRGARSVWSKLNRDHVERLTKLGRMRPQGLAAVAAAKADGRWDRAYDSQREAQAPPDFLAALAKNRKAQAFFETLNRANRYSILWRLQTAKQPETRQKRLHAMIAMLGREESFHPKGPKAESAQRRSNKK